VNNSNNNSSNSKDPIIGFIDESSLCLSPNKVRVINTKHVRYSESNSNSNNGRSKTIFGFMAINGNDVAMVSDRAKADDMLMFLELIIRRENPCKDICIVLDNARIHKASMVVKKAEEELNIRFVYLPPYSPDLNPIEFGWKDLKRELAILLDFNIMVEKSKEKALELFKERKNRYTNYWVKRFICTGS
jgi:putative transposase